MRTAITILTLVLAATGCVTDEPAESETTSDVTLTYSSPTLEIVARIANERRTADELRSIAASTKAPVNPTWLEYQKYRTFTTFLKTSADKLDGMADMTYEDFASAKTSDEKDAIAEQSQMEMIQLQQSMEQKIVLEHYEVTPYAVQATSVTTTMRQLLS